MADIDTGLNAWQMASNHNRMIDFQATAADQSPVGTGRSNWLFSAVRPFASRPPPV